MKSSHYVCEKLFVAVLCMCGEGTFKERLENATISALYRLSDDEGLNAEISNDLKFILSKTKHNMIDGKIIRIGDEIENRELIEKMVHVLLETDKKI